MSILLGQFIKCRHCEERSDETIHFALAQLRDKMDCFALLAMTGGGYSAACFSKAFSASSAAAFASTKSTIWFTISPPSIVWSVLPAA